MLTYLFIYCCNGKIILLPPNQFVNKKIFTKAMRHICLFDSSLSSWNFFYPMKTEPNNLMGKIQTAEFLFTL